MAWVARYPWGGIQSQSMENPPPAWMTQTPEFARTGGWVWENPVGTAHPGQGPGPAAPTPPGIATPGPYTPAPTGGLSADNTTARAKASEMLYGAMQGLPNMSPAFMGSLQGGQMPTPGSVTPQTLAQLAKDEFLSDQFFALIRAAGLYPTSYVSEIERFQPKGMAAAPSFL